MFFDERQNAIYLHLNVQNVCNCKQQWENKISLDVISGFPVHLNLLLFFCSYFLHDFLDTRRKKGKRSQREVLIKESLGGIK